MDSRQKKHSCSIGSELVLAFDGDTAGAKYTKRWTAYLKQKDVEFSAVMPLKGDWNDLLTNAESPEQAAETFEEEQEDYETQAKLALAATAQDYARIYAANYGDVPGLFPFKGCYWWSSSKESKDDDLITTIRVSDFTLSVNHFQLDEKDEDRPVFKYSLRVKPRKGRAVNALATDLKSSDTLRGFFFNHAKASWTGSTAAAYALGEIILHTASFVQSVRDITFFLFFQQDFESIQNLDA